MIIHDVKQNTPEWLALRMGKVTASEIDHLVSPTGKIRTGEGPQKYLYKKLAEKLVNWAPDDFFSQAANNGSIVELEAVPWYAFAHGVECVRAGFCSDESELFGFSPDALIGEDGGLEIKAPTPPVHIQYLTERVVPSPYITQVQFSLYVSKRKWWKFVSYSRQFPALVVHVEPDPDMQESIHEAMIAFLFKFEEKMAMLHHLKDEHESPLKAAYEAKIANWEKTGVIP